MSVCTYAGRQILRCVYMVIILEHFEPRTVLIREVLFHRTSASSTLVQDANTMEIAVSKADTGVWSISR